MVRMGGLHPAAFKAAKTVLSPNNEDSLANQMLSANQDADIATDDQEFFSFDWKGIADEKLQHRYQLEAEEESGKLVNVLLANLSLVYRFALEEVWPHIQFDILLGEPVLSNSFFVPVVIMFFKRFSPELLVLLISFQYSVNPLYVVLAVVAVKVFYQRSRVPKNYVPVNKRVTFPASKIQGKIPPLPLLMPESPQVSAESLDALCAFINSTSYDHILVGSDFSTLYTAALLAKCGHRCCVLRVQAGHQIQIATGSLSAPVTIVDPVVNRLSQYQNMLDVVIPTCDPSKRVLFEPVGHRKTGYTHTVVRSDIFGQSGVESMGGDTAITSSAVDFSFRAGQNSLAEDMNVAFGTDNSATTRILSPLVFMCELISMYLATKVGYFAWKNDKPSTGNANNLQNHVQKCAMMASQSVASFFSGAFASIATGDKKVPPPRELNGIASVLCAASGWDLSNPTDISMLHIGSSLAPMPNQGCYVPKGGVTSLYDMLATTIIENGGMITQDIKNIKGFIIEQVVADQGSNDTAENTQKSGSNNMKTRTLGILIKGPSKVIVLRPRLSVISGLGAIATYKSVFLVSNVRESGGTAQQMSFSNVVPTIVERSLEKVEERRPRILCVFLIKAEASNVAEDDLSCNSYETRRISSSDMEGLYVKGRCKMWSPSERSRDEVTAVGDRKIIVELIAGDELLSVGPTSSGPRTYQAADSSVAGAAERKKMYTILDEQKTSLLRKVSLNILQKTRPTIKVQDIKQFTAMLSPLGGYELAGLPSKYAADLKSISPFENLYLCGGDVSSTGFSGDIQGGWVAANAALGYQIDELLMQRTVTTDLRGVL